MQLKTGAHPQNTRVEIIETESGEVVNEYTFDQANHAYTEEIVLMNAGCYRIRVRDIAGEGMGNGFFQFKDSNNQVIMKGGGSVGHFTYELSSEVQCDGTLSVNETEQLDGNQSNEVQKVIENGQIVIIKEGRRYNVTGQRIN